MRIPLRFLVFAVVLGEVALFIVVGKAIGVFGTLGLTILSTVAGILLLRQQGVTTLRRIKADLRAGRAPAQPIAEGGMLAVAAVLMILPGFLTSALGLLLFVTPVRATLWRRMGRFARTDSVRGEALRRARPQIELDEADYVATTRRDSPRPHDSGARR